MKTAQILLCFTLMVAAVLCEEDAPKPLRSESRDSQCKVGDAVYKEGQVYRVFSFTDCVLNMCRGGQAVEIRSDCVDSYGRCHPHNSVWRQGCNAYVCKVQTTPTAEGGKTTRYQPVKFSVLC